SSLYTHTAPTEIYTLSLHDALPIFLKLSDAERNRCDPTAVAVHQGLLTRQLLQARHAQALLTGALLTLLFRPPRLLEFFFLRLRSEEHTSELQSRENLVCRLLLEKK